MFHLPFNGCEGIVEDVGSSAVFAFKWKEGVGVVIIEEDKREEVEETVFIFRKSPIKVP
jgi:hypothetical protein